MSLIPHKPNPTPTIQIGIYTSSLCGTILHQKFVPLIIVVYMLCKTSLEMNFKTIRALHKL